MANIIMLDLDGPIFPDVTIQYDPLNRKPYPGDVDLQPFLTYWKMCERFINLWKYITDVYEFKENVQDLTIDQNHSLIYFKPMG